jgi:outer membrane protein TolC
VPLIDKQVKDVKQLLDIGEGDSLVLLESLIRAHEARLQLIDVQYEIARLTMEIRFLSGPATRQDYTQTMEVTP